MPALATTDPGERYDGVTAGDDHDRIARVGRRSDPTAIGVVGLQ